MSTPDQSTFSSSRYPGCAQQVVTTQPTRNTPPPSYRVVIDNFFPPPPMTNRPGWPQPPPTYSQSQRFRGGFVPSNVEHFPKLTRHPKELECPSCSSRNKTEVELHSAKGARIVAAALCLLGCWPFCLLPLTVPHCQQAHHRCRRCRYLIYVYDPWV